VISKRRLKEKDMKRCYFCKKLIWPWQSEYLGITPAHANCDLIDFMDSIQNMTEKGIYTIEEGDQQIKNRTENAYF